MDDTIIQQQDGHLFVVSNAGTRDKIIPHLKQQSEEWRNNNASSDLKVEHIDRALVALQGPLAASALETLLAKKGSHTPKPVAKIAFMEGMDMTIAGIPVHVTRCGYTGEDGFEIAIPNSSATQLVEVMLQDANVKLAGLGPRDSLRLEAGLCLYGHDIDESVSPVEATLVWTIGKRRREPNANAFAGRQEVLDKIKKGVEKKRVGFVVKGAPARGMFQNYHQTMANKQRGVQHHVDGWRKDWSSDEWWTFSFDQTKHWNGLRQDSICQERYKSSRGSTRKDARS